jgi:hypothetical protein
MTTTTVFPTTSSEMTTTTAKLNTNIAEGI